MLFSSDFTKINKLQGNKNNNQRLTYIIYIKTTIIIYIYIYTYIFSKRYENIKNTNTFILVLC